MSVDQRVMLPTAGPGAGPAPAARPHPPCLGPGHRACLGCGEALGARLALDADRKAARAAGGDLLVVNATGCLEVFSSAYPYSSWPRSWTSPTRMGSRRSPWPATGAGDLPAQCWGA